MINVNNLTKMYGPTRAINSISFEVKKGEVLGFLGPNGAGKTTTMRILTCFMPATSGTATIAGYDVFENSLEIRKKIGYLPESAPLYMEMGVLDYLEFIAEIRNIPKSNRAGRIKRMIDVCGLEKVVKKNNSELSKGYKQRVCMAQSMIHDPDILILDEPTIGLDPNQIIEIRELIKNIGREKTVILCSHILPEVEATCDRVIIINEGEIVVEGTPGELISRSKGDTAIYITIKGYVKEIESKLGEQTSIKSFVRINKEDDYGAHRFEITSSGDGEVTEELFHFVVKNGWTLTELTKETVSLEDVFTQLTK